jgi:hypothetical protein
MIERSARPAHGHVGLLPVRGEKWLLSQWMRGRLEI